VGGDARVFESIHADRLGDPFAHAGDLTGLPTCLGVVRHAGGYRVREVLLGVVATPSRRGGRRPVVFGGGGDTAVLGRGGGAVDRCGHTAIHGCGGVGIVAT